MDKTTNETIRQLEGQYTSGVYTKRPVAIVRGLAAHLWDADGRNISTASAGRAPPTWGTPTRWWRRPLQSRPTA